MRNRSLLGAAAALPLILAMTVGATGCKDTEALAQLKKAKTELEDREDELASAEKRMKTAEKDAAAAKTELDALKESLDKSTKKQEELTQRLKNCGETPPIETPSTAGTECTAYFKFMEDCIPLMPSAVQSPMRDSMEQMKKALTMGGGMAAGAMENGCKAAREAIAKLPQCSSLPKPGTKPPCNCDPKDPLCDCTP